MQSSMDMKISRGMHVYYQLKLSYILFIINNQLLIKKVIIANTLKHEKYQKLIIIRMILIDKYKLLLNII